MLQTNININKWSTNKMVWGDQQLSSHTFLLDKSNGFTCICLACALKHLRRLLLQPQQPLQLTSLLPALQMLPQIRSTLLLLQLLPAVTLSDLCSFSRVAATPTPAQAGTSKGLPSQAPLIVAHPLSGQVKSSKKQQRKASNHHNLAV